MQTAQHLQTGITGKNGTIGTICCQFAAKSTQRAKGLIVWDQPKVFYQYSNLQLCNAYRVRFIITFTINDLIASLNLLFVRLPASPRPGRSGSGLPPPQALDGLVTTKNKHANAISS